MNNFFLQSIDLIETIISLFIKKIGSIIASPDWLQAIGAILALFVSLWISTTSNRQARAIEKAADERIINADILRREQEKIEKKEKSKRYLYIIGFFLDEYISRASLVEMSLRKDSTLDSHEQITRIDKFLDSSFLKISIEKNIFLSNSYNESRLLCELHRELKSFSIENLKPMTCFMFSSRLLFLREYRKKLELLISDKPIDWDDPQPFEI